MIDNKSRYNCLAFAYSGSGYKYPLDIFIYQDSILLQRSIFRQIRIPMVGS